MTILSYSFYERPILFVAFNVIVITPKIQSCNTVLSSVRVRQRTKITANLPSLKDSVGKSAKDEKVRQR